VRWRLRAAPAHGAARIRHGRLIYRAPRRFHGREALQLVASPVRRGLTATRSASPPTAFAQIAVDPHPGLVVRALGDSVTAGFGYYGNGASMTIGHLLECRPPAKGFDDACSSNSLVTDNEQGLEYAADYGLSNNISWAAQWANDTPSPTTRTWRSAARNPPTGRRAANSTPPPCRSSPKTRTTS
jgi:hypothetical protein